MGKKIQQQYAGRETYYRICTPHVSPPVHPVSTTEVVTELEQRGLSVSESDLNNLVRTKDEEGKETIIPKSNKPARHPRWTPELIEIAARYFNETYPRSKLTPLSSFLKERGLTMDSYLLALESAHKEIVFNEFGKKGKGAEAVKVLRYEPNPDDYEMHISPARNKSKAAIWFTLHDDARKEIEKIKQD